MATHSEVLTVFIDAVHILHRNNIIGESGSLSVRAPENHSTFLTSQRPPSLISSASDIMTVKIQDGSSTNLASDSATNEYSQISIHSSIYAHYPGVQAVVHGVSPNTSVYGLCNASGSMLRVAIQGAGFLNHFSPVFDPAQYYQSLPSSQQQDLLISNQYLGDALARSMDSSTDFGKDLALRPHFPRHSVAMLRGQGAVCCGESLQEAVYKIILVERNAEIQTLAMLQREGTDIEITYLDEQESRDATRTMRYFVQRAWEQWSVEIRRSDMYKNELLKEG